MNEDVFVCRLLYKSNWEMLVDNFAKRYQYIFLTVNFLTASSLLFVAY